MPTATISQLILSFPKRPLIATVVARYLEISRNTFPASSLRFLFTRKVYHTHTGGTMITKIQEDA